MKADLARSGLAQQSFGKPVVIRTWLILVTIALLMLGFTNPVNAAEGGLLYTVTSTGDGDLVGTNTICDDGTGHCTLRAAIEASNSHPGTDDIDFSIPTSDPGFDPGTGAWTINLTKALPDISADIGITGPGADTLIVRRDTGGDYRIFKVTTTGAATFSGITISNGLSGDINSNDVDGGGILNFNGGTVNVTGCTISGNSAGDQVGGGIYNQNNGTVSVTNSTIRDNRANFHGGGIYNTDGTVNLTNCTVSGNAATAMSATGGGIYNVSVGTVNVTNTTIAHNFASFTAGTGIGGGIHNVDGSVSVKSSIIARNVALSFSGQDVFGNFTTGGFNLIGEANGGTGFDAPTDQTGTTAAPLDPKLDPKNLLDNGGSTQTIALLIGSPAIDKGTSDGLTGILITDQRGAGFARTFDDPVIANATGGDGTDVGAFEVQPAPTPTPSPSPTPVPTTLGNISTRLRVETGDNVLIGGFIITGTEAKKVMVRAIGPSLPLAGVLADPTLELHDGAGTLITSNDNWMDAPNRQEIIDSTIPPTNDLESAILMTLDPGLYTAIVRGVKNTTGIGLVESYDLESTADSELANISTRGLVQTGDDVMIGGFILVGPSAREVLVRAIGPSLPVPGKLADPTLELFDGNGMLLTSNDDWRDTQEAEIMATTIPPSDDAESAIVQTLAPAAYTAIVRGKNGTTGVALVEVYALAPGSAVAARNGQEE